MLILDRLFALDEENFNDHQSVIVIFGFEDFIVIDENIFCYRKIMNIFMMTFRSTSTRSLVHSEPS